MDMLKNVIEVLRSDFDCSDYEGTYGCDLHNALYNEDYYIIGRYNAKQFLEKHGDVFEAIDIIKEYETSNFGEVNTDFTEPEHVVNMLVYIAGENLLGESKRLSKRWNSRLTEEDLEIINEEIRK